MCIRDSHAVVASGSTGAISTPHRQQYAQQVPRPSADWSSSPISSVDHMCSWRSSSELVLAQNAMAIGESNQTSVGCWVQASLWLCGRCPRHYGQPANQMDVVHFDDREGLR